MTSDREMVILAVLEGKLGVEHLTDNDIQLLEERVMNAVLNKLTQSNPTVFSGMDKETLQ